MDEQDAQPDQHGPENENIELNVGMVLVNYDGPDPAYADWERKQAAEATRVWASFFSPGNPNYIQVGIPTEWANFFTVMLMSLEKFYWAKEFLSSKVTQCLEGKWGHIIFHYLKVAHPAKVLPVHHPLSMI